jgi:hypothetical protein
MHKFKIGQSVQFELNT